MRKYTSISLPNIVVCLLGVKHCGKTSLARHLAELTPIHAVDTDKEIIAAYPPRPEFQNIQSSKQVLRLIYKIEGAPAFQELEYLAISKLLTRLQDHPNGLCIATGGGICDNPRAIELLRPVSVFVYIKTSFETIWERLERKGMPSYLESAEDPKGEFRLIYDRRSAIYQSLADITISGDNIHAEKTAELLEKLHNITTPRE